VNGTCNLHDLRQYGGRAIVKHCRCCCIAASRFVGSGIFTTAVLIVAPEGAASPVFHLFKD